MWLQREGERQGRRFTFTIGHPYKGLVAALSFAACLLALTVPLKAQSTGSTGSHELLYIVDSNGNREGQSVLVVDPQQKAVVKTYPTGDHPDIAVSPDGKRLYLTYDYYSAADQKNMGKLDVIDTASGAVITSVENSHRWQGILPAYDSTMAISTDGHWLYFYKMIGEKDGSVNYGVAIFDTVANKFLPDFISLPDCAGSALLPWPSGRGLSVLCSDTKDIRSVQFSNTGVPNTRLPSGTPIAQSLRRTGLATALLSAGGQATILMSDGEYSTLNLNRPNGARTGQIAFSPALTPAGWQSTVPGAQHVPAVRRFIMMRPPQQSQGSLFLTLSRSDRIAFAADAIAVLNPTTLQQTAVFEPGYLFWNAVVSHDGKFLYLLSAELDPSGKSLHGNVHVISASDGSEIATISGVGTTPTILIPAP